MSKNNSAQRVDEDYTISQDSNTESWFSEGQASGIVATRRREASGIQSISVAALSRVLERRLLRSGVPYRLARRIAQNCQQGGGGPRRLCADKVTALLREALQFCPAIDANAARVLALVGPTGVGKTTTVAKLAANAVLIRRKTAGLVSIDNYRVGASEQLERYADLIGIPFETADTEASLNQVLKKMSHLDRVFIDTAGRAPRDGAALLRLAQCLHGVDEHVDIQLCVSATSDEDCIQSTIAHTAVLAPSSLNVTKLDETERHGVVAAAQLWSGLPLSHFTIGQRVPEDIEQASAGFLAALLTRINEVQ